MEIVDVSFISNVCQFYLHIKKELPKEFSPLFTYFTPMTYKRKIFRTYKFQVHGKCPRVTREHVPTASSTVQGTYKGISREFT